MQSNDSLMNSWPNSGFWHRLIALCSLNASVLMVHATPLTIVEVNAPAINYVFSPTGTVTVNDSIDDTLGSQLSYGSPFVGNAFLQSRTYKGQSGTPAEGLYAYEYRIDMQKLENSSYVPCISDLTIKFRDLVPLDYNGDKSLEEVFVVTSGGIGNVKPISAEQNGDRITFRFSGPAVCAMDPKTPKTGDSSFFFGLVSKLPPQETTAELQEAYSEGGTVALKARAPALQSQPDLVVELSAPSSAQAGADIGPILVATAKNVGESSAPGTTGIIDPTHGYMIDLILSTDTSVPPGYAIYSSSFVEDVLLQGGRTSNTQDLGPGDTQDYPVGGGIPIDTPSGLYYLCARIAPGEQVSETDESNNVTCVPITIKGTGKESTALPEIDVQGNGTSIPHGDTSPSLADNTDFGVVYLGSSPAHPFTLYNQGEGTFKINSVQLSGTGCTSFSITPPLISNLGVGESTSFQVTFSPGSEKTFVCTIKIDSNDKDENPYTFNLTGTGQTISFNLPSSSVLPSTSSLGLSVEGNGEGRVTSSDGHLDCMKTGGTCQATYGTGTNVKLIPTAAPGSYFSSWGGHEDCNHVQVQLWGNRVCTAYFRKLVKLTVDKIGEGSVTGHDLNCGKDCSEFYLPDTLVTLTTDAEIIYPESDGQPMADNTIQFACNAPGHMTDYNACFGQTP